MAEKTASVADKAKAESAADRRVSDEDRRKTVAAPRTPRLGLNTMVATPFGIISLGVALHEWDWSH